MKAHANIRVRWNDCDPMGHMNNALYFTFMEQSRVALFKGIFDLPAGEPAQAHHFPFILAEIKCQFLKPCFVDEVITIHAEIKTLKNSSFIIHYSLINSESNEEVAKGESVQVWYDYKTGRSTPIPDSYRQKLLP